MADLKVCATASLVVVLCLTTFAAAQFGWLKKDDKGGCVRERQPQAADLKASLLVVPGFSRAGADSSSRVVVLDYRRPGLKGPARVRQYSIPAGADMYRVVCSASVTQFQKYQPAFEHIAATFALKSPAGTR